MLRLFTLLLPLMLATGHAHGAMRSVRQVVISATAACPQATDNGCAAAGVNGEFQNASLLTSAQQSGQNSLLPTRAGGALTLNIPAVDYPIGPDKTLTPQDPRGLNDSVCHYQATPVELVLCYASGTVNYTLNNYDFGGHKIGKGVVNLYLDKTPSAVSLGSVFTISNCYFDVPAGTGARSGFGVSVGFTGNWSVVSVHNHYDGTNADLGSDEPFRDDNLKFGTTFSSTYDVFTNVNTVRVYGGGADSGVAQSFNYDFIEGLNGLNTTSHGEVSLISCGSGSNPDCQGQTIDHFTALGNFIIGDTYSQAYCDSGGGAGGCINSAVFFLSAGEPHAIKYTTVTVSNNISVTNTSGTPATPNNGNAQWGEALFSGGWSAIGTFNVSNNWVDATGAFFCTIIGPASNGVTASASGNTLTITASTGSFNNNPIDLNWKIYQSGFTTANITAFGTGFGNLGTYTFDGPPQTVASSSGWILVPGIATANLSNNYNLADPSHTGVPVALNINGPTFQSTCQGTQ